MTSPLVSVIIPAYNQAQYLPQAIQSVLDQTFTDLEVVVVDDGSTDDTPSVSSSFSDSRVGYIWQQNRGLSGARNTGISNSAGRYLVFLDADDWLLPRALELEVDAARDESHPGILVGGWVHCMGSDLSLRDTTLPAASINASLLIVRNQFPVHSAMVERRWLERVGFFDESLRACEDWDMWLRLSLSGCQIKAIPHVLCVYRRHAQQMTRDEERMRKAMLAVLDKAFARSDLPEQVRNELGQAYAYAYLRAAARGYRGLEIEQAQRDVLQALSHDPRLADQEGEAVAQHFLGWAFDLSTQDPVQYLKTVFDNLPNSLSTLARRKRRLLADVHFGWALDRHRERNRRAASSEVLKVIWYRPQLLTNRGLASILLRSMFER